MRLSRSWQSLLISRESGSRDATYGVATVAIERLFDVLAEVPWFSRAGTLDRPAPGIQTVSSWSEALHPLMHDARRSSHGHLEEPSRLCVREVEPEPYASYFQKAQAQVSDRIRVAEAIPKALTEPERAFVDGYTRHYVSLVIAELVSPASRHTTYFREMLPWFHVGHFPCGWAGAWPLGRLKVL